MHDLNFSEVKSELEKTFDALNDAGAVQRIWQRDHTVWATQPDEISNRLGWLESPAAMQEKVGDIQAFVADVLQSGFTHAVLLGMGGSSLAPEVFRKAFGVRSGTLELSVLDSTDPGRILELARSLAPEKTLFIVSTKSGGTVETLSFFKYFYNMLVDRLGADKAGAHFVAITDPGSSLEKMAGELHFRKVFLNDPNIGGRFSVLSYFGLAPAALVGVDIRKLLERALRMAEACRNTDAGRNPGVRLGACLGLLAESGRDKATFIFPPEIACFGAWVEQLVAESSGKQGKGILPVVLEEVGPPEVYADDRVFVYTHLGEQPALDEKVAKLAADSQPVFHLELTDLYDLGAEFFRWEFATAVACERLQVNPFDQPDVESAKALARKMVAEFYETGAFPETQPDRALPEVDVYGQLQGDDLAAGLRNLLYESEQAREKGRPYVALQAYLHDTPPVNQALKHLRQAIRGRFRLATTLGFGPRFLHSTGQLHKGDAGNGIFLQFTSDSPEDALIPDAPGAAASAISFAQLENAQALGDRQALLQKGRRVLRLHLKGSIANVLERLAAAL